MKNQNEKYCNECAAIISKNAYICPHCGVKQSGVNIDTERLAESAKVGTFTVVLLLLVFIRGVARVSIPLFIIGGAASAAYYYYDMQKNSYSEDDFYVSVIVMIIVPIIGYFISLITTKILRKLNYQG